MTTRRALRWPTIQISSGYELAGRQAGRQARHSRISEPSISRLAFSASTLLLKFTQPSQENTTKAPEAVKEEAEKPADVSPSTWSTSETVKEMQRPLATGRPVRRPVALPPHDPEEDEQACLFVGDFPKSATPVCEV